MRTLLIVGLALLGIATPGRSKPLNIVLFYADDWRHDVLGVANHPVVKTPHLDALANDGIRFTRACVTTSICGVSRASLLTGQWMSRHGNEGFQRFKTPWEDTCPGLLRKAGWWVGHVGKWHCGEFPKEHFDFGRSYAGTHFVIGPDGRHEHITQRNQLDAIEFLRGRPKDKPFCLTVNFFAPHAEDGHPAQYLPQEESASLYRDVVIPIPESATADAFQRLPPAVGNEKNEGRRRWHLRFDTPEKYQNYMKNYYRLITEVDAACGKILDELEAQGLSKQTLVIFTTDNGYFHGEHGLADKWYPYEESVRVPLIVRDPRLPIDRRGSVNDDFVLNVDIAPMMLAAAGQPVPKSMQGRDFSRLYLSQSPPIWRDGYFYEHAIIRDKDFIPASEAWVQRGWKYLYWPDSGFEELFDLIDDPLELNNCAAAQPEQLAAMRERFQKMKQEAKSPIGEEG
jgi:arylsulfatase